MARDVSTSTERGGGSSGSETDDDIAPLDGDVTARCAYPRSVSEHRVDDPFRRFRSRTCRSCDPAVPDLHGLQQLTLALEPILVGAGPPLLDRVVEVHRLPPARGHCLRAAWMKPAARRLAGRIGDLVAGAT